MRETSLSVVIPSYNRGQVLLDTLGQLLNQDLPASEIVVVDQTNYESSNDDLDGEGVAAALLKLHKEEKIQWVRKTEPSIPKAMNSGLITASSDWVLFLDDDIKIEPNFIAAHCDVIESKQALAHVGQVVQPWQHPDTEYDAQVGNIGFYRDLGFAFNSAKVARIHNCMAGNLCVNREAAIGAGGFDQNFFGPAYRFETEFCRRFIQCHGDSFLYAPSALIHHLHLSAGGTRAHGHHLTSPSPAHSMGDYYFALLSLSRSGQKADRNIVLRYMAKRFFTSIKAKFYLKRPWYIPVRLFAELRGFFAARAACKNGQSLIGAELIIRNQETSEDRKASEDQKAGKDDRR